MASRKEKNAQRVATPPPRSPVTGSTHLTGSPQEGQSIKLHEFFQSHTAASILLHVSIRKRLFLFSSNSKLSSRNAHPEKTPECPKANPRNQRRHYCLPRVADVVVQSANQKHLHEHWEQMGAESTGGRATEAVGGRCSQPGVNHLLGRQNALK